jgi:hypothetical protein
MIFAIVIGIILGTGGAPITVALAMTIVAILSRGVCDVLVRKNFITGTESTYVLYVQNLGGKWRCPEAPLGWIFDPMLRLLHPRRGCRLLRGGPSGAFSQGPEHHPVASRMSDSEFLQNFLRVD